VILFVLVVILYCSIRIHLEIKRMARDSNNQNAIEIHREVTKVLIIQALLPILVIIVPLCISIVLSLLGMSVSMLGVYSLLSIICFTSIKVGLKSLFKT
jgi:hypothetical protein